MEDIIKTIPIEIRSVLNILSDENRLALVILLLKEGEMSFSELRNHSGLAKNTLSHHLKTLTQAALVSNYYRKREGTNEFSYYSATDHAKDCVDGIIGIFQPKRSATEVLRRFIETGLRYDNFFGASLSADRQYSGIESRALSITDDDECYILDGR